MKKTIAVILGLCLLLSLAGCGGSAKPNGGSDDPQIENKVELSLDKTSYDKEERIEVTLDFDKLDRDSAVIVVVPHDRDHGKETAVHDDYEEYRWLADFSELPFYLWAPNKDGVFDVRVYENGDGGKELASITIAVGSAELPSSGGTSGGAGTSGGGSGALAVNDSVATYSGAYNNYTAVYNAMNDAYYAVLDPHNAELEAGDNYWDNPEHFSDIVNNFVSINIAFTATFGDSGYEAAVATLFDMFDMKDGKVEQTDASSYRMTYLGVYNDPETWESFEDAPWEALCGFDAAKGSLWYRDYVTVNGERKLNGFVEFVPLGGGRYALQSAFERGIVELLDGKAVSYDYAAFNDRFDPEADAIFPSAGGVDDDWVSAGGGIYQHITLSSDSLHIWAAEVTEGFMAAPERDITIER